MYQYKCKIIEITDGDTVKVDIDVGFNIWVNNVVIRLLGIDTPESRTTDKIEKIFGLLSKNRLAQLLPINSIQIIKTTIDDKYGRVLGDFFIDNASICDKLVKECLAVAYHGQLKADVRNLHEENRTKLIVSGIAVIPKN